MASRPGLWIAALVALVGLGSLAACALSPAAGVWFIGLFLASVLLFQLSARAAPDTTTDTATGTVTDSTSSTVTDTTTDTGTTTDMHTYTGVCLSAPKDPDIDSCRCSTEQNGGGLVFLTPALLVLAPTRRRRELIDRLAADNALPDDVLDRLRRRDVPPRDDA